MNKTLTLALIALCLHSCKKENTNKDSNSAGTTSFNPNPEGCTISEMHSTSNGKRTLSRRDYFTGERLDSSIYYTDGKISTIVHYSSYSQSYQEGVHFNAQRKKFFASYVWYDQYNRAIKQKYEDGNGNVTLENTNDYGCQ